MSSQSIFVEQFARLFHHHHDVLASEDEVHTMQEAEDHNLLVAAARKAILDLETRAWMPENRRRYFAKPGEAEWGC